MEDGALRRGEAGTPQGGVISPLLANIFLHEVLDVWFHREVQPRLRGRTLLVRYADDAVMLFEYEDDARRVMDVLPLRFGRYGLTLHPEKTRLVPFKRPDRASKGRGGDDGPSGPESFGFLGFTIHWGKSLAGKWVVRERTAKNRFRTPPRVANPLFEEPDAGNPHVRICGGPRRATAGGYPTRPLAALGTGEHRRPDVPGLP